MRTSTISVNQTDYTSSKIERHFYKVLKYTDATAVLIEARFITNPNNASIITSQDFINQLANRVNAGIGGNGDGCGCD